MNINHTIEGTIFFYFLLTFSFMFIGWTCSPRKENRMGNALSLGALGLFISSLTWRNYSQYVVKNYH